jgi:hypothetical protein
VLLIVTPLTYFLIGWAALLLVPGDREHWIANIVSLICALGAGWYVWSRTGYGPTKLVSRISYGALIFGGIGFLAGFFGPFIFSPGASQGPLLGIFITGPLGFLLGGIGGFAYWWIRDKRDEENVPLSWKSAFELLPVIGVLFIAIGVPEYLPVASCLFEEAPPSIDKQQLRGLGHIYFARWEIFRKVQLNNSLNTIRANMAWRLWCCPPYDFRKRRLMLSENSMSPSSCSDFSAANSSRFFQILNLS